MLWQDLPSSNYLHPNPICSTQGYLKTTIPYCTELKAPQSNAMQAKQNKQSKAVPCKTKRCNAKPSNAIQCKHTEQGKEKQSNASKRSKAKQAKQAKQDQDKQKQRKTKQNINFLRSMVATCMCYANLKKSRIGLPIWMGLRESSRGYFLACHRVATVGQMQCQLSYSAQLWS